MCLTCPAWPAAAGLPKGFRGDWPHCQKRSRPLSADTDLAIMRPAATEACGPAHEHSWPRCRTGRSFRPVGGEHRRDRKPRWRSVVQGRKGVERTTHRSSRALRRGRAGAAGGGEGPRGRSCRFGPGHHHSCARRRLAGADHIGDMQRSNPDLLLRPRPGFQALAIPLIAGETQEGLLVVITAVSAKWPPNFPTPRTPARPAPRPAVPSPTSAKWK